MGVFGMLVAEPSTAGSAAARWTPRSSSSSSARTSPPARCCGRRSPRRCVPDAAPGTAPRRAASTSLRRPTPFVIEHAAESDVVVVVDDDGVASFATTRARRSARRRTARPADARRVPTASCRAARPLGGAEDARRLRLVGTVLAAAQLVGVAQGALDVASAYALERHQFGAPIGSFQAVKHLLADMYVRVELARSATYAAAAVFDDDRAGDVTTAASTAKLLAGEAGIANGRTAVQVLGGMGFTWQMAPHYFLKRAWVLEEIVRHRRCPRAGAERGARVRRATSRWRHGPDLQRRRRAVPQGAARVAGRRGAAPRSAATARRLAGTARRTTPRGSASSTTPGTRASTGRPRSAGAGSR